MPSWNLQAVQFDAHNLHQLENDVYGYTVQRGNTIAELAKEISRRTGRSYESCLADILESNGFIDGEGKQIAGKNPNLIEVGDALKFHADTGFDEFVTVDKSQAQVMDAQPQIIEMSFKELGAYLDSLNGDQQLMNSDSGQKNEAEVTDSVTVVPPADVSSGVLPVVAAPAIAVALEPSSEPVADSLVSENGETPPSLELAGGYLPIPEDLQPAAPIPSGDYLPLPDELKKTPLQFGALQLHVQPTYPLLGESAGIPRDFSYEVYEGQGEDDYIVRGYGPSLGSFKGGVEFGVTHIPAERTKEFDRKKFSLEWRTPITLSGEVGSYQSRDYEPWLYLSSQGLQELGDETGAILSGEDLTEEDVERMLNEGNADAYFDNVGEAFTALFSEVDPSSNVNFNEEWNETNHPYYQFTLTPWLLSENNANGYAPPRRFGIGPSAFGYGGYHFMGLKSELELSLLRANVAGAHADLVVNGGLAYYNRYDPKNVFQEDFWQDGQFLLQMEAGVGLRISTEVFEPKKQD